VKAEAEQDKMQDEDGAQNSQEEDDGI